MLARAEQPRGRNAAIEAGRIGLERDGPKEAHDAALRANDRAEEREPLFGDLTGYARGAVALELDAHLAGVIAELSRIGGAAV